MLVYQGAPLRAAKSASIEVCAFFPMDVGGRCAHSLRVCRLSRDQQPVCFRGFNLMQLKHVKALFISYKWLYMILNGYKWL
jgi:hypothetical protein